MTVLVHQVNVFRAGKFYFLKFLAQNVSFLCFLWGISLGRLFGLSDIDISVITQTLICFRNLKYRKVFEILRK